MQWNKQYFKTAWDYIDLKGIREEESTYYMFTYENLPPIPYKLDNNFLWLKPFKRYDSFQIEGLEQTDKIINRDDDGVDLSKELITLQAQAFDFGFELPPELVYFLTTPELNKKIKSPTACYFDVGECIEKIETETETYFLMRFMMDQQSVLFWYLCFNSEGEYCIISTPKSYGSQSSKRENDDLRREILENDNFKKEDLEVIHLVGYYCASSFKEFIYRINLENNLWYKLSWYKAPFDEEEEAYMQHYLDLNK